MKKNIQEEIKAQLEDLRLVAEAVTRRSAKTWLSPIYHRGLNQDQIQTEKLHEKDRQKAAQVEATIRRSLEDLNFGESSENEDVDSTRKKILFDLSLCGCSGDQRSRTGSDERQRTSDEQIQEFMQPQTEAERLIPEN